MKNIHTTEPRAPSEWEELRGRLRHQSVEVLRLIAILVQDAVILLAGFLAEFAYEHWLRRACRDPRSCAERGQPDA